MRHILCFCFVWLVCINADSLVVSTPDSVSMVNQRSTDKNELTSAKQDEKKKDDNIVEKNLTCTISEGRNDAKSLLQVAAREDIPSILSTRSLFSGRGRKNYRVRSFSPRFAPFSSPWSMMGFNRMFSPFPFDDDSDDYSSYGGQEFNRNRYQGQNPSRNGQYSGAYGGYRPSQYGSYPEESQRRYGLNQQQPFDPSYYSYGNQPNPNMQTQPVAQPYYRVEPSVPSQQSTMPYYGNRPAGAESNLQTAQLTTAGRPYYGNVSPQNTQPNMQTSYYGNRPDVESRAELQQPAATTSYYRPQFEQSNIRPSTAQTLQPTGSNFAAVPSAVGDYRTQSPQSSPRPQSPTTFTSNRFFDYLQPDSNVQQTPPVAAEYQGQRVQQQNGAPSSSVDYRNQPQFTPLDSLRPQRTETNVLSQPPATPNNGNQPQFTQLDSLRPQRTETNVQSQPPATPNNGNQPQFTLLDSLRPQRTETNVQSQQPATPNNGNQPQFTQLDSLRPQRPETNVLPQSPATTTSGNRRQFTLFDSLRPQRTEMNVPPQPPATTTNSTQRTESNVPPQPAAAG